MPSGPEGPGTFGAYYTKLNYSPEWDKDWRVAGHPDVVVRFDDGGHRFVFWRGTSYIPCWVTGNDKWYTNEFVERRGWHSPNTEGCVEPMSDKQCRFSHVRIIESNDARVVVHWRYAPVDVHYEHPFMDENTGWADWVDEYYTIYPDATGVRSITVQSTNLEKWIEFHEAIVLNQPGTLPEDNIQPGAVSVANMMGEHHTYFWDENGGPKFDKNPERANIYKINLKSDRGPFALVAPPRVDGDIITPYLGHSRNSIFNWWDHWPVSQAALDGRGAKSSQNPSHTSLCHIDLPKQSPVTCFGPQGDASVIRNGALEWVTKEDAEISLAFYKTTHIMDSLYVAFEYSDLWTSQINLSLFDWSNNAISIKLDDFNDELVLNHPDFKRFERSFYLPVYDDYEEFGEIREISITVPDSEKERIIRINNLHLINNEEENGLSFSTDFNLPDGSPVTEINEDEQAAWEPEFQNEHKRTKLMLHGLTEKNVEDLVPMALSWTHPAKLVLRGEAMENRGFDREQMAYIIRINKPFDDNELEFELQGNMQSPLYHPVIIIENWRADSFKLEINGQKALPGDDYRFGTEHGLEGDYLVLWSRIESTQPVNYSLSSLVFPE